MDKSFSVKSQASDNQHAEAPEDKGMHDAWTPFILSAYHPLLTQGDDNDFFQSVAKPVKPVCGFQSF